jgi:hypothetical protein
VLYRIDHIVALTMVPQVATVFDCATIPPRRTIIIALVLIFIIIAKVLDVS